MLDMGLDIFRMFLVFLIWECIKSVVFLFFIKIFDSVVWFWIGEFFSVWLFNILWFGVVVFCCLRGFLGGELEIRLVVSNVLFIVFVLFDWVGLDLGLGMVIWSFILFCWVKVLI